MDSAKEKAQGMTYSENIPENLFREDGHYLGRPANFDDRIIRKRVQLVEEIPGFTGNQNNLLEIGCGNGATMFLLADQFNSCLGLEVTDEHLQQFNYYKSAHNVSNCEYRVMNIEKSDPPALFERLISFEVIEHLESEDSVSFYNKALKPGGHLAISVPNKWWIFETHGARLPLLPWNRVPFFSWLPRTLHEKWANARIYTKKRIVKLLEKHGFEIVSAVYITAPMDVLPKGRFRDFIIKTFFNSLTTQNPFKSTSIFVHAIKK